MNGMKMVVGGDTNFCDLSSVWWYYLTTCILYFAHSDVIRGDL